ncbi:hypothetical protein AB0K48_15335, partial [Nonomuraea sp. NPDC055795]
MRIKPGTAWQDTYDRCCTAAPEAFHDDRVLNHWGGFWHRDGRLISLFTVAPLIAVIILALSPADEPTIPYALP